MRMDLGRFAHAQCLLGIPPFTLVILDAVAVLPALLSPNWWSRMVNYLSPSI